MHICRRLEYYFEIQKIHTKDTFYTARKYKVRIIYH